MDAFSAAAWHCGIATKNVFLNDKSMNSNKAVSGNKVVNSDKNRNSNKAVNGRNNSPSWRVLMRVPAAFSRPPSPTLRTADWNVRGACANKEMSYEER